MRQICFVHRSKCKIKQRDHSIHKKMNSVLQYFLPSLIVEKARQCYVAFILFLSSDLGGMILTSKGMKNSKSALVCCRSKQYSWASFSAVHVLGERLWLLRTVRASTIESLPFGTFWTSEKPKGLPCKLDFGSLRSSSIRAGTSFCFKS